MRHRSSHNLAMYKFRPLLKQMLWGGDRIIPFKQLDVQLANVGESWEISGVKDSETVISEGPDAGKPLNQLVREQQAALVGSANYDRFGCEFPLLVKFIDAHQDLSIQVHPDDETAQRLGRGHGKTEMWYCLSPSQVSVQSEGGKAPHRPMLYCGLKQQITPEQYQNMVAADTITDAIAGYEVSEGDVFYIPAGRIHAIGTGCFVAEIQQTSDVTFRIYDYKRCDKDGNYRELHTREAAESIDFDTVLPDYRTHYELRSDEPIELLDCPFFTTAVYDLTEPMTLDYSELDSFVILVGVGGEGTVSCGNEVTSLRAGETILLPATTCEVRVEGRVRFLETYCLP